MLGFYLAMLEAEDDKSRFEKLYNEYEAVLFNVANSILKDCQLSEDAVNETFLALARNMNKISDKNCIQIRNYLIIIVKNNALRIYNKYKREINAEGIDETVPDFSDIEIEVESSENQRKLFSLLKNLDEKYGDVLMMKYFYGMRNKEIAEALGITLQNVKIRLHRGKIMLKEKLNKEETYDRETV